MFTNAWQQEAAIQRRTRSGSRDDAASIAASDGSLKKKVY
jgi:hypothetical protein